MSLSESKKLRCDQLRKSYDLQELPKFDEVEPVEFFNQQRAINALRLGFQNMQEDAFNVFVSGPPETGKTKMVKTLLASEFSKKASDRVKDWCYVYHFSDKEIASWISFPRGKGRQFKKDIHDLVKYLLKALKIEKHLQNKVIDKQEKILEAFNKKAEKHDLWAGYGKVAENTAHFGLWFKNKNKFLLSEDKIEDSFLSDQEKERAIKGFVTLKSDFMRLRDEMQKAELKLKQVLEDRKKIEGIKEKIILKSFKKLQEKYTDNKRAIIFLKDMEKDVKDNIGLFDTANDVAKFFQNKTCLICGDSVSEKCPIHGPKGFFSRYLVHLLIDNSEKDVPIVVKNISSYRDIFGKISIEPMSQEKVRCDHTLILPGALHEANGGFLILKTNDLLTQPLFLPLWQRLVHALKSKEIKIESITSVVGYENSMNNPLIVAEPIPLDIRVILIGNDFYYHLLSESDDLLDFKRVFKIKAQIEDDMSCTNENIRQIAGFLKNYCEKEKTRLPDQKAFARIIEFSSEVAGDKEKLTTEVTKLKMLIREADYYAGEKGHKEIFLEDIEEALSAKKNRSNFYEEKTQEYINREIIDIQISGEEIGQINGLAVLGTCDYDFGKPYRIITNVYLGQKGVVSIERETKTSGESHSKGVEILASYFRYSFGQDFPLAFSADIGFEQQYGMIDGDSASSAELYTLLSAFAGVPIIQGIAVTGSVNKRGVVQVIGGINQKIKGFFDICKHKGLTGEQGVIIPAANETHLMLDREIIDAVKERQFHVWSVKNIEEGIEILTGVSFEGRGGVRQRVKKRLLEMAKKARDFSKKEKE